MNPNQSSFTGIRFTPITYINCCFISTPKPNPRTCIVVCIYYYVYITLLLYITHLRRFRTIHTSEYVYGGVTTPAFISPVTTGLSPSSGFPTETLHSLLIVCFPPRISIFTKVLHDLRVKVSYFIISTTPLLFDHLPYNNIRL